MEKEILNVCTLLTHVEKNNNDLALTLLKGDKETQEKVLIYFKPLLDAAKKKTLRSIPKLMEGIRKGNNSKLHKHLGALSHLHNEIESLRFMDEDMEVLPDWVRLLSNLKGLVLIRCGLKVLPDWINEMKNLTFLSICENPSIQLPKSIHGLPLLKTFYLQDNELSAIPKLEGMDSLRQLYLNKGNKLSRKEINQLQKQYSFSIY